MAQDSSSPDPNLPNSPNVDDMGEFGVKSPVDPSKTFFDQSFALPHPPVHPTFKWWHLCLLGIFDIATFQLLGFGFLLFFGGFIKGVWLTVFNGALSLLVNCGFLYLFGIRSKRLTWEELKTKPIQFGGALTVFLAIVATVGLFIFRIAFGIVLSLLFPAPVDPNYNTIITGDNNFWLGFLFSAALIPLAEEAFYRGLLFKGLRQKWGFAGAALLSSVFFGIAHLSLAQGILAAILGFCCAYFYERSKSFYIPWLIHCLNNGLVLIILWLVTVLS